MTAILRETSIEDLELIQQVLAGQTESFSPLVLKYQQRVRGFCRSALSQEAEAEEAAQEIFLKAYQALSKFRGDSSFSTWLYRIASNHCIDLLRKRNKRPTLSWDALLEQAGDSLQKLVSDGRPAPGSSLENQDLMENILSKLPPAYKNLLILREAEGLSYVEIAETLECSVDAVKSRLSRARRALHENLQHFSEIPRVQTLEERRMIP